MFAVILLSLAATLAPGPAAVSAASEDAPQTALQQAAAFGETERVRQLLEHGVAVDVRGPAGHSAMTLAAQMGHAEAVSLLLQAGADPQWRSDAGGTAAVMARGWGHRDVALALERHGHIDAGPERAGLWWLVAAAGGLAAAAVWLRRRFRLGPPDPPVPWCSPQRA